MTNEEIKHRIARHFGLGEYGVRLAQEYLDEYAHNLMEQIRSDAREAKGLGCDLYATTAADLRDPLDT